MKLELPESSHPSHAAFDLALLGQPPQSFLAHLDGCAACRERLDQLRHEQAEFERSPRPRLAAEAIASAPGRRIRLARLLSWITPALAIGVAASFAIIIRRPPVTAVRLKGGAAVELFLKRGSAPPRRVEAGERFRPGDSVQLGYRSEGAGRVSVFSLDRACVAHLERSEAAQPQGLVPQSWRLDGKGGDRLYVAFSDAPISPDTFRAAAARSGACAPDQAPPVDGEGFTAVGVALVLEHP